ncbi:MAG: hypothetical protein JOY68_11420 [Candidatus Dormibacteraeota bacterium]|nr:hypothetical protein [Candidatus Dormibacteraeota bacterium]
MYPFERFTDSAKQVLTAAQREAELSHHSYIGTEHLLLGTLLVEDSLGARVLDRLGVFLADVRSAIQNILDRNDRIVIQQIIPTPRVKKVIEYAFAEAQRGGQQYVGSEHIVSGILIEGEGIAAHILMDRGVTLDVVQATIAELRDKPEVATELVAPRHGVPKSASLERIMQRAVRLAGDDAAPRVDDGHVLNAVLQSDGRAALTLRHLGVDPDAVVRLLHPPRLLVELRRRLRDAEEAMPEAELDKLRDVVQQAEQEWLDSLS